MPDVSRGVYNEKYTPHSHVESVLWLSHGDGFWIMSSMHMYAEFSARNVMLLYASLDARE